MDFVQSYSRGYGLGQNIAQNQRQNKINTAIDEINKTISAGGFNPNSPEFKQLMALDPNAAANIMDVNSRSILNSISQDKEAQKNFFRTAAEYQQDINSIQDPAQLQSILSNKVVRNIVKIQDRGGDASQQIALQNALNSGDMGLVKTMVDNGVTLGERFGMLERSDSDMGVQEKAFNSLIKKANLNPTDVERAARIKLGLDPRQVGSADMTLAEKKDLRKLVSDMKSEQAQAIKFAELTGTDRAKRIDKGFDKINTINSKLSNYDRAIQLIDEGAGVGRINKLWPTIRATTIELDNIKNQLGLDVISGASFGALSEGELNMALQTALPTDLPPLELKNWLIQKKNADIKLLDYVRQQIDHLDQGGTTASFLRMMERRQQPVQQSDEFAGFKVVR